jgi:hypothetical protein
MFIEMGERKTMISRYEEALGTPITPELRYTQRKLWFVDCNVFRFVP